MKANSVKVSIALLVLLVMMTLTVSAAIAGPSKIGKFCSGYAVIYRQIPSKVIVCYDDAGAGVWTMTCAQRIIIEPYGDGQSVSCIK